MINDEWLLIWSMMAVTFIPRYLPIALASRFHIPPLLANALGFVPIAVLTAIIAQTTFVHDGQIHLSYENAYLYGASAAVVVAIISKHLFLTIAAGLSTYALAFIMI